MCGAPLRRRGKQLAGCRTGVFDLRSRKGAKKDPKDQNLFVVVGAIIGL
jgi:hypothetical protein